MATNAGEQGDDPDPVDVTQWTEADQDAARQVERRCGIALVPDGMDD